MSHREYLEQQEADRQAALGGSVRTRDLLPVLERLIATLNRIENKLDKS